LLLTCPQVSQGLCALRCTTGSCRRRKMRCKTLFHLLNIFLLLLAVETTAFHFQTIVANQALDIAALDLT
jgi:hypothetical protein